MKVIALEKAFGVNGKMLRRWGRALESGNAEELMRAWAGRGGKRKLTVEVRREKDGWILKQWLAMILLGAVNIEQTQLYIYASVSYRHLRDQLEDKQMKGSAYKALEKERQEICRQLKSLLFQEHQHPGKDATRAERIKAMDGEHQNIRAKLTQTEKEISRLEALIEQDYRRLNTANKGVLDALKFLAHNAFYQVLQSFKKLYDNFRDDHALLQNLTRADGLLLQHPQGEIEVQLFPTAHYPPTLRRVVKKFFDQINTREPMLPDRSGRQLRFSLSEKEGIQMAISNE